MLIWKNLKWPKGEPEKIHYVCEHCKYKIEEHHKEWMLEKGEWRAENPEYKNKKKVGFHISALYNPLGWYSWAEAAEDWEGIQETKSQEELMVFVNTVLGEPWKNKAEKPDWHRLYERREDYKLNIVPKKGLFLTCGVDVQKDRLELEVVAWGRNKESWSVDYRVILGDTSQHEPWDKLEEVVSEKWEHESGAILPLSLMAVDSGFNTQMVYNWCRKFLMTDVIAIKGFERSVSSIGQPKAVDINYQGKRQRHGTKVWPIGVNILKTELYNWLNLNMPTEEENRVTGFCHFPQYEEGYFKQLTAEELVPKIHKGYRKYQWVVRHEVRSNLEVQVLSQKLAYSTVYRVLGSWR